MHASVSSRDAHAPASFVTLGAQLGISCAEFHAIVPIVWGAITQPSPEASRGQNLGHQALPQPSSADGRNLRLYAQNTADPVQFRLA